MEFCLLAMIVLALLVGACLAHGRPEVFPFFLLVAGVLRLGARGALGGIDPSAAWLLGLMVLAVVALWRLPGRRRPWSLPEGLYALFLGWCVLAACRAAAPSFAARVFVKLLYPFLVLVLARHAMWERVDLRAGLTWLLGASLVFSLLAGGITYRCLPAAKPVVYRVFWNIAAASDHASLVGVLALICWRRFRRKWYLALAAWLALSTLTAGNRTGILSYAAGIGVLVLATTRKRVALSGLVAVYLAAAGSLVVLPHLRAHMFFDPGQVDPWEAVVRPHALRLANIDSHGRFAMWQGVLSRFFAPHPAVGSGLGATQAWFYGGSYTGEQRVEHSSHVRLLADTGAVGCGLFVAAMASCMVVGWRIYRWSPRSPAGLCGLYAVCAFPVLMVCMAFDNLVNYVLPAGQYPFAFAGMSLGLAERQADQAAAAALPGIEGTRSAAAP